MFQTLFLLVHANSNLFILIMVNNLLQISKVLDLVLMVRYSMTKLDLFILNG